MTGIDIVYNKLILLDLTVANSSITLSKLIFSSVSLSMLRSARSVRPGVGNLLLIVCQTRISKPFSVPTA